MRCVRQICRFNLALPHASHLTVVTPLILTPSDQWTRCLIAAGPGCPNRLCHNIAVTFCTALVILELVCTQKAAWPCCASTTHWSQTSTNMATTDSSCQRSIVGSDLLSHQIPCCRNSLNDTRLHRISGHRATLLSWIDCSAWQPLVLTCTVPYPWIHTRVLPAYIQSPGISARRFIIRSMLLHMCVINPESRINKFLSRYCQSLTLKHVIACPTSIFATALPCSHSICTSGVCDILI